MNRLLSIILILSCAGIFSCKKKEPPPVPPTSVNLDTVKARQVFYYDTYPATTQALSQVNIIPQVQGYITAIHFTEGSHVKKGQVLYEIDKRLYQAAYDAAVANVKVNLGNQNQAQQDQDRYTYLNQYHAVAKQQYDHAIVALQNSKNQVQGAKESVKTAQTNLSYAVIRAPFDGTIGFSQVKLGNMVSVGQTVLNTISTNNPMAIDFVVGEKQLAHFEQLERDKQHTIDSLFTIVLPDNTIYKYTGKLEVIDRAVDPQTGSIRVRLVFPNPQNDLKVGMSCVVRVHNQEATPKLLIPGKAIVEQMGEYFVFVAKDTIMNNADSAKSKDGDNKENAHKNGADTAKDQGPHLYVFQKRSPRGKP